MLTIGLLEGTVSSLDVTRLPITELPVERFLVEYMQPNRPLIVTGALEDWDISHNWIPEALNGRFGEKLFRGHNLKSRENEFCCANEVLSELRDKWQLPAFLPNTKYLLPFAAIDTTISPVNTDFPAKALLIAHRGARKTLRIEPWASCSVLCQLYGSKRWYFYAPGQRKYLESDFGVVDVTRPDFRKFPAFSLARLAAACTLRAGEVIYVPHGWYHQVECDCDSVSLTWNFVHQTTEAAYVEWLTGSEISELDEGVLQFFYAIPQGDNVVEQVLSVLRNRFTRSWLLA